MPIFIFDSEILDKLPKDDARVSFIHDTVQAMRQTLQDEYGSSLAIFHGKPLDIFKTLIKDYDIATVYTNRDYEPYARTRDTEIEALLTEHGIAFHTFKDQVYF
jgi:deoxyribodipyrimidine photo-lyase